MDTEIIVRGPGGTINYEVELIRRALEAVGIKVHIINHAPHDDDVDSFVQYRNELTAKEGHSVTVQAVHIPWGG